jgi:hypothetical protein
MCNKYTYYLALRSVLYRLAVNVIFDQAKMLLVFYNCRNNHVDICWHINGIYSK